MLQRFKFVIKERGGFFGLYRGEMNKILWKLFNNLLRMSCLLVM